MDQKPLSGVCLSRVTLKLVNLPQTWDYLQRVDLNVLVSLNTDLYETPGQDSFNVTHQLY